MDNNKYVDKLASIINEAYEEGKKIGWNNCRMQLEQTTERVVYYDKEGKEIKTFKYTIPARK